MILNNNKLINVDHYLTCRLPQVKTRTVFAWIRAARKILGKNIMYNRSGLSIAEIEIHGSVLDVHSPTTHTVLGPAAFRQVKKVSWWYSRKDGDGGGGEGVLNFCLLIQEILSSIKSALTVLLIWQKYLFLPPWEAVQYAVHITLHIVKNEEEKPTAPLCKIGWSPFFSRESV